MPPPERSGAVSGAAGNACGGVWLRGKKDVRVDLSRVGLSIVRSVAVKDQVEAHFGVHPHSSSWKRRSWELCRPTWLGRWH